ncbi:coxsackie adenovirus receptor-like precursor [Mus musculus]|uniref:CAR-like soluble protein n=1 Tax=Mus musculus TaxID=10090 RepID=Q1RME4_MOUSE|nr:coxsackie adenovirus receptor-like precursor [Mus musculus]AAI14987.1 Gene model 1123, (NCBI) [Mus musculus]AAI15957.1 Gene model 1123, (NCBI) [Mus musculus]BAF46210.1 CAR-like soluble protein [Mus musculus]|eukprot:NP_001074245.1 coxsackie adenovirus receptor-like precursor [Mus musculus]
MVFLLGFLFLCGVTDHIGSVSITTPEQTIQEVQGETVHLPCMFTLSPEDQGPLDIEWLRLSGPNNEAMDHVIILYAVDKIYSDFYQDMRGRVNFTSNGITSGEASIKIRDVQPADSGTYLCKVKTAPGVAKTTVQLTVVDYIGSVSITTPEQTIEKDQGETVHLPCMFTFISKDQGPLNIEWLRLSGPNNEAMDHVVILYSADKIHDDVYPDLKGRVYFTSNDIKSGDASINITNVQLSDAGTYQCKVKTYPGTVNRNLQLAVTDHIGSVSITTPEQTIQKARGETVHLPCTFTLSPEDHGPLFIDWMQLTGPQNEVVNRMFIVYLADKIYDNFYQDMKGRVQFTSNDIRSGEASINITDARLSDAGTYQCGVSHAFGTAKGTIQLTVVG